MSFDSWENYVGFVTSKIFENNSNQELVLTRKVALKVALRSNPSLSLKLEKHGLSRHIVSRFEDDLEQTIKVKLDSDRVLIETSKDLYNLIRNLLLRNPGGLVSDVEVVERLVHEAIDCEISSFLSILQLRERLAAGEFLDEWRFESEERLDSEVEPQLLDRGILNDPFDRLT